MLKLVKYFYVKEYHMLFLESFLNLTPSEWYVYSYFIYQKEQNKKATSPLGKNKVIKELGISRPTFDKVMNRLTEIGHIEIIQKKPLVVLLLDKNDEMLDTHSEKDEASEPADYDGHGEYEHTGEPGAGEVV